MNKKTRMLEVKNEYQLKELKLVVKNSKKLSIHEVFAKVLLKF